jgi:hypothetical protein
MQRHLRGCPACREQQAAEERLGTLLHAESEADSPADAAAIERLTRQWAGTLSEPRPAPVRRRFPFARLLPASAVGALAVGVLVVGAVTAPSRAVGAVSDAMKKVRQFHVRMELPGMPVRYEAWGRRDRAARVEEWEGKTLTLVVLDDGKRLRSYDPQEQRVSWSGTQLKGLMRQTLGFSATKMLRKAAQGELFQGQASEWLGEAKAREVAQIRRHGTPQRRIQVDLENGFFERMVIYADVKTDRLTQANLYLDRTSPDEAPTARVYFDYPEHIDASRFELRAPKGTQIRREPIELPFPTP